jgi:O-antigen/teichoic acid export membrane protein
LREQIQKFIFGNDDCIEKKAVFWNMLFSVLSALQSAIMIMLVTRVDGTENAGILSIAYASAYLMYTVGTYGVRNFHATDSRNMYTYKDYKKIRLLSCGVMMICSVAYCLSKAYEGYKLSIVMLVCLLKLEEAFEDLYHGELQRSGRLDIAGRLGTIRLGISYIVFGAVLIIRRDLIEALVYVIIVGLAIVLLTRSVANSFTITNINERSKFNFMKLLMACFPLFVMSFLSIYISNSPKYAIDLYLSEKEQAYYAVISMPVFTINLLSSIIYRPKLLYMAELWNVNDKYTFRKIIWSQIGNIFLISIVAMGGGLTIGVRILEIIYGISLNSLKKEFAVLLIGGGVVAVYNLLSACLTIIRKQVFMLIISILVMVLATVISNPIVQYAGLAGASYLYLILMLGEMISIFLILIVYLYRKDQCNAVKDL